MAQRTVSPGLALLPLRLFLGGTFVYAGVQKLTDPGFLHPGAPTYIGTQLQSFANATPGGFLLRTFAFPHPILAGVGVALLEIAIGLFVLLGLKTRLAAIGGLGLNLVLFATASWHTSPYFLGSDIVFVFAWLPFAIAGAAGQPALDNALRRPSPELSRRVRLQPADLGYAEMAREEDPEAEARSTRRAVVAEAGGAAVAIAGIAALIKGPYTGATNTQPSTSAAGGQNASTGPSGGGPAEVSGASAGGSSGGSSVPSGAVKIGPLNRLPEGQAALYHDPASGQPDILIRTQAGDLQAFSAVCTHAGCTVSYQGGQIVCPCHGGVYNTTTGAVEAGPPPSPLEKRTVTERGGEIYALPS